MHYIVVHSSFFFHWQRVCGRASIAATALTPGKQNLAGSIQADRACILRFGSAKKELFGYDPHTTNNRMELMPAIQGLLAVKEPCAVEVTTDAEYVRQGVTVWVKHWKHRHWWKKNRPIRNADLWIELDALAAFHQTEWIWTKGASRDHSGNCVL